MQRSFASFAASSPAFAEFVPYPPGLNAQALLALAVPGQVELLRCLIVPPNRLALRRQFAWEYEPTRVEQQSQTSQDQPRTALLFPKLLDFFSCFVFLFCLFINLFC